MTMPALDGIPGLAPGCRLNQAGGQEDLLLVPEGALRLHGPARAILENCDGARTVAQIVESLHAQYPDADPADIARDVGELMERLRQRGVLVMR